MENTYPNKSEMFFTLLPLEWAARHQNFHNRLLLNVCKMMKLSMHTWISYFLFTLLSSTFVIIFVDIQFLRLSKKAIL